MSEHERSSGAQDRGSRRERDDARSGDTPRGPTAEHLRASASVLHLREIGLGAEPIHPSSRPHHDRAQQSRHAPEIAADGRARESTRVELAPGRSAVESPCGIGALPAGLVAPYVAPAPRIDATPEVTVAAKDSKITYEVALPSELYDVDSFYTALWYVNHDAAAVRRGARAKDMGPEGRIAAHWYSNNPVRWDKKWDYAGTHRIVCWIRFRPSKGQAPDATKITYTQVVRDDVAIADDAFKTATSETYDALRTRLAKQEIDSSQGVVQDQRVPGRPYIATTGLNPCSAHLGIIDSLSLHDADKLPHKPDHYRWYVRAPSWKPFGSSWQGFRRAMIAGHEAFDLASMGTSASFDFHGISPGVYEVLCEGLDAQGRSVGIVGEYAQSILTDEQHLAVSGIRQQIDVADRNIARIQDGTEIPLRGVYVNAESNQQVRMSMFVGADAKDPKRFVIIDLMPGLERTEYKGERIEEAILSFCNGGNSYPTGHIRLEVPTIGKVAGKTWTITTSGKSTWQKFSSTAGIGALVVGATGAVLTATGVGAGFGVPLMCISATLGAASGALDLVQQLHDDRPSVSQELMDVLMVATSLVGMGQLALNARALAPGVDAIATIKRTGAAMQAVTVTSGHAMVFLMAVGGIAEIDETLGSKELTRGQKIQRVCGILVTLAYQGLLMKVNEIVERTVEKLKPLIAESHYRVLGVKPNAMTEEIKDAWRAFAKAHHPDRAGDDTLHAERFRRGKAAYELLSDPAKRAAYDDTRKLHLSHKGRASASTAEKPAQRRILSTTDDAPAYGTHDIDQDAVLEVVESTSTSTDISHDLHRGLQRASIAPPASADDGELVRLLDGDLVDRLVAGEDVEMTRGTVTVDLMAAVTRVTGREVALVRIIGGRRVLRLGTTTTVSTDRVVSVIAHTHPGGSLWFSPADVAELGGMGARSNVLVGPDGIAARLAVEPSTASAAAAGLGHLSDASQPSGMDTARGLLTQLEKEIEAVRTRVSDPTRLETVSDIYTRAQQVLYFEKQIAHGNSVAAVRDRAIGLLAQILDEYENDYDVHGLGSFVRQYAVQNRSDAVAVVEATPVPAQTDQAPLPDAGPENHDLCTLVAIGTTLYFPERDKVWTFGGEIRDGKLVVNCPGERARLMSPYSALTTSYVYALAPLGADASSAGRGPWCIEDVTSDGIARLSMAGHADLTCTLSQLIAWQRPTSTPQIETHVDAGTTPLREASTAPVAIVPAATAVQAWPPASATAMRETPDVTALRLGLQRRLGVEITYAPGAASWSMERLRGWARQAARIHPATSAVVLGDDDFRLYDESGASLVVGEPPAVQAEHAWQSRFGTAGAARAWYLELSASDQAHARMLTTGAQLRRFSAAHYDCMIALVRQGLPVKTVLALPEEATVILARSYLGPGAWMSIEATCGHDAELLDAVKGWLKPSVTVSEWKTIHGALRETELGKGVITEHQRQTMSRSAYRTLQRWQIGQGDVTPEAGLAFYRARYEVSRARYNAEGGLQIDEGAIGIEGALPSTFAALLQQISGRLVAIYSAANPAAGRQWSTSFDTGSTQGQTAHQSIAGEIQLSAMESPEHAAARLIGENDHMRRGHSVEHGVDDVARQLTKGALTDLAHDIQRDLATVRAIISDPARTAAFIIATERRMVADGELDKNWKARVRGEETDAESKAASLLGYALRDQTHADPLENLLEILYFPERFSMDRSWIYIDRNKIPEIKAFTSAALNDRMARMFQNRYAEDSRSSINYAFNAERDSDWNPDHVHGYANPAYFDRVGFMQWRLKEGMSASDGIREWLAGHTIAECLSYIVGKTLDNLRAAMGNELFDAHFGAKGMPATRSQLEIGVGVKATPLHGLWDQVSEKDADFGRVGARPVMAGDWFYFQNDPRYLTKHPAGYWQGENAICASATDSAQTWAGFGVEACSEAEMLKALVTAYNVPRDAADIASLESDFGTDRSQWPTKYTEGYSAKNDGANDITQLDVVTGFLDGQPTSGLVQSSGIRLSATKVKALVESEQSRSLLHTK